MHAPHRPIQTQNLKEKFLVDLFDTLWARYRGRMPYVRQYEALVEAHGGTFVNDHIAFRTLGWQEPAAGLFNISRIFESLGYVAAACYEFPDKFMSSLHFQHPRAGMPKIFITQLKSWELSAPSRKIIAGAMKSHRPGLSTETLAALHAVEKSAAPARAKLLKQMAAYFENLPWDLPEKEDVMALNRESQFGAWVLVNGYDVNHFTASVDSHGVPALQDIDKTVEAMRRAGIPMKNEIEGAAGTKLRQSSTEAVVTEVRVKEGKRAVKIPWTYAYFELAERPPMKNPQTGHLERFEGFLGGQATHLFEMTKLKVDRS